MESIKNYWAGENNGHKVLNRTATIGTVATLTAVAALTTLLLAAPHLNLLSHLVSPTLFWPLYSAAACGVIALPIGLFLYSLRSKNSLSFTPKKTKEKPLKQFPSWLSDLLGKLKPDFIEMDSKNIDWKELKSKAKSPLSVIHRDGRSGLYLQLQVTHIPHNTEFVRTNEDVLKTVLEIIDENNIELPPSSTPFTIPVCVYSTDYSILGKQWFLTTSELFFQYRQAPACTSIIINAENSFRFWQNYEVSPEREERWRNTEIQDNLLSEDDNRFDNLAWILLRLLSHLPVQLREWDRSKLYRNFEDEQLLGYWKLEFIPSLRQKKQSLFLRLFGF